VLTIREIVVVEGKNDAAAVRRASGADTLETNGSAVDEDVLRRIELACRRRGVILLFDPDYAGEKIRRTVASRVPGCRHAFLKPEEARRADGKIGVEYASDEAIRRALASARADGRKPDSDVRWDDVLAAGLAGRPDSAARRRAVGDALGWGYCNSKQFWRRIQMFGIRKDELFRALETCGLAETAVKAP